MRKRVFWQAIFILLIFSALSGLAAPPVFGQTDIEKINELNLKVDELYKEGKVDGIEGNPYTSV